MNCGFSIGSRAEVERLWNLCDTVLSDFRKNGSSTSRSLFKGVMKAIRMRISSAKSENKVQLDRL